MIINSADIAPLSLWEIYEFVEIQSQNGVINISPLTPSVIRYRDVVESDGVSLDYKKKLHYLTEDLISQFLTEELWVELIRVYLKYLHERIYEQVDKLEQMVFDDDWFIETFFEQYATGLVAENIVSLTIEDKDKIYKLAKMVSNMKGIKMSFETMLGLLNQDMLLDKKGKRVFENTLVSIIEDARFNEVDPSPNPKLFRAPFTYGYQTNEDDFDDYIRVMEPLHPIGFNFEPNVGSSLDRQEIIEEPEIDFYLRGLRCFRWNGLYDRSGYTEINSKGYELKNYPILIDVNGDYYYDFYLTNT